MRGTVCVGVLSAVCGASLGQGHEAFVICTPRSVNGMWVTNSYANARSLPPTGVLWIDPGAADYDELVDVKQAAMFGELTNRRIERSIDYIVLGPGTGYRVPALGLVNDDCPGTVDHFGLPGAYTFAKFADQIRAGGISGILGQGYFTAADNPIAFDANETYGAGLPGGTGFTGDLFIGASLPYIGTRGVNVSTALEVIDRAVAADGTEPIGTFFFMQTTDAARSSPRQGLFNSAVSRITAAGGLAFRLTGQTLPQGTVTAFGVMTGDDVLDFTSTAMVLAPGAFGDHLTSFAAHFDTGQQTKVSSWLSNGAAGSYGTVEEPCNFSQKFPSAYMHSNYFRGLTLGESVLRSLAAVPFQGYLVGDPLCRPFATGPAVSVSGVPTGAYRGSFRVSVSATPTRAGTGIGPALVLVDGVVVAEGSGGSFLVPTQHLSDGWHELRVVVVDDSAQAVSGEWIGSFETANRGKSASITPSTLTPNRTSELSFTVTGSGGTVEEVRVIHWGRVIAAGDGSSPLRSRGEIIGPGPARVWAEVDFTDGSTAVSAPVTLGVTSGRPTPTIEPVSAYGYTARTAPGEAFVVELPAFFADDVTVPSYTLLTPPAQATLLGGEGPYLVFRADAGASGGDALVFEVSNGVTTSSATVSIQYRPVPVPCLGDVNGDGATSGADFAAWVMAYNGNLPSADQNGDGLFGVGSPAGVQDFSAWIQNFNAGCPF